MGASCAADADDHLGRLDFDVDFSSYDACKRSRQTRIPHLLIESHLNPRIESSF